MNRSEFDYAGLGRLLRARLDSDGRGYRAIGEDVGVAPVVFSRLAAGQPVAAHSVIAVCDWLGLDPRGFYSLKRSTGNAVKQPRNQALGDLVSRLRESTAPMSGDARAWVDDVRGYE